MKGNLFGFATVGVMAAALVAGSAMGQGPRPGQGAGQGPAYRQGAGAGQGQRMGQGPRQGMGMGMGQGMGQGMGFRGAGGWWNRVTPQTPQQKAFVDQVSALHNRIQAVNQELRALTAQNAPAAQIQAKQQEVATLRSQVQQLTTANQALLQQMGVPAGSGVCDGSGPKGGQNGQGMGPRGGGMGRGMGQGPRDGSGRMAGPGRGMRLGPQDGTGPNPDCQLKTR